MKNINLLDCTLRDGGYYNNWNFSIIDANKYLKQIYAAKINTVEIGFKFLKKNNNYGYFAYINKNILRKIIKSRNTNLAVMINADDFISKKVNKIFNKKFRQDLSNISIIRIAVHFKDIYKISKYLKKLKLLDFKICLNLMQINSVNNSDLSKCLNFYKKNSLVDVFYFADSFGNLNPQKVKNICKTIKKNWSKDFGIHSHDNCGLALKNSVQAFKSGANWIDGTIQGMGRGAGNVKTEDLIRYFGKNYKIKSISNISNNLFSKLKQKYKWGKSKNYKFAAKYNIHPSYIQALEADDRFNKKIINKIIKDLSKIETKKYDPRLLEKISFENNLYKGKWDATNWCKGRTVLILGQGKTLKSKSAVKKLKKFIINYQPLVICINLNNNIPKNFIDYYVSSSEMRLFVDHHLYSKLKKTIIIPLNRFKKIIKNKKKLNILDYGSKIFNGKFICKKNYVILPNNQSFGYALGLSLIGKAKDIVLAGFDGYSPGHIKQIEMENIFKLFYKNYSKMSIKTLTKTIYPVKYNYQYLRKLL